MAELRLMSTRLDIWASLTECSKKHSSGITLLKPQKEFWIQKISMMDTKSRKKQTLLNLKYWKKVALSQLWFQRPPKHLRTQYMNQRALQLSITWPTTKWQRWLNVILPLRNSAWTLAKLGTTLSRVACKNGIEKLEIILHLRRIKFFIKIKILALSSNPQIFSIGGITILTIHTSLFLFFWALWLLLLFANFLHSMLSVYLRFG